MDKPLKRTSLKSSPEDAAFYKQHRDSTLHSLRKGTPRADVLREMTGKGVPEKTAERILTAVEMEVTTAAQLEKPRTNVWKSLRYIALVWGAVACYLVWQLSRDATFHWGYLIAAGVISLILTARVVGRFVIGRREPHELPPPP